VMDGGGRRREGDGRSDEMIWDHIDGDDASLPKKKMDQKRDPLYKILTINFSVRVGQKNMNDSFWL